MRTIALALVAAALAAVAAPRPVTAQQVLEIGTAGGRDVVNDFGRALEYWMSKGAVDQTRGFLYSMDLEFPEHVLAFSLHSGEIVMRIPVPRGDGPGELRSPPTQIIPTENGGLFVTTPERVLQFDSAGGFVRTWTEGAAIFSCELDGRPVVPVPSVGGGLIHGGRHFGGPPWSWETDPGDPKRYLELVMNTSMTCINGRAYVVSPSLEGEGTGRIHVYSADARERILAMPPAFRDRTSVDLARDGRGHILVFGYGTNGAVLDPETGCYAVIRRNAETSRPGQVFAGVLSDSAVVFHREYEDETVDGQRRLTLYAEARRVSLEPLHRVSGEPCPGMLPSVR